MKASKVIHCPDSPQEFHSYIVEFENAGNHESFLVGPFFDDKKTATIYSKAPEMYKLLKEASRELDFKFKTIGLRDSEYSTLEKIQSLLKEIENEN